MEENPTRICELLVGLGDVEVLSVDDAPGAPLGVHIRTRVLPACGGGVVERPGPGGVGGPSGVRALGAPRVAQVAVALPGGELCGGVVHRGR